MRIHNPAKGVRLLSYPEGHIYQRYGENPVLYCRAIKVGDKCLNGHNGIDIVMAEGTPILATQGTVVDVKNDPRGYGKHIRILTDPDEQNVRLELTYGHLRDIYITKGIRVESGQVIGTMGNTGFVISGGTAYWGDAPAGRGVHLHFGTRWLVDGEDSGSVHHEFGYFHVKDYNNGLFGYVDPMQFLDMDTQITYLRAKVIALATKARDLLQSKINSLLSKR